jgi:hypothetical protein
LRRLKLLLLLLRRRLKLLLLLWDGLDREAVGEADRWTTEVSLGSLLRRLEGLEAGLVGL